MEKSIARCAGAKLLYHDHDGGIDDYLSILLLMRHHIGAKACLDNPDTVEREYGRFRLLGITSTPANSLPEDCTRLTQKILSMCLFNCRVPVAESTLPIPQPFPQAWRSGASIIDALPLFMCAAAEPGEAAPLASCTGQELLAESLLDAQKPVTLLITGPLTNLAWALNAFPELESHIEEVVIMGGAVDVPGNVAATDGALPTAEWNFHCDPAAAARVWRSGLPLTLVPLDTTNQAPITAELLQRLHPNGTDHSGSNSNNSNNSSSSSIDAASAAAAAAEAAVPKHSYAALALAAWVATAKPLAAVGAKPQYAYDLVAAAYIVKPALFPQPQEVLCGIVTEGERSGTVERLPAGTAGARSVKMVGDIDVQGFYTMLEEDWVS